MLRMLLKQVIILLLFCQAPGAAADAYDDLLQAVRNNDVAGAEVLFSKGMDVNTTDPGGNTLLMLAAREDRIELAKSLLRRRAGVAARNSYGENALMLAAGTGSPEMVTLLVEHGAPVNQSGWNPLIYAAWQGKTQIVKYLLEKGADIDAVAPNGVSALMMATRGGHLEAVKLLLWEVADPNLKSDSGATALGWALRDGNSEIAALLRQAGAKE